MPVPRPSLPLALRAALLSLLLAPAGARAQEGGPAPRWMLGARAVGVVAHAAPEFDGRSDSEAFVTQPTIAGAAHAAGGRVALLATVSLEGLTIPDGEPNPGIWGEGFADRRHPHTYLHELVGVASTALGPAGELSAALGKGFVPFGTDDPMARPFVRYPANHHLAQLLERALAAVAWRAGALTLEGAAFNGDEPEDPADAPDLERFGDSWAARATLRAAGVEAQASVADVASPEWAAGFGADQRKWSASVRHERRDARGDGRYALVEWARTDERVAGAPTFRFESVLAEGALARRGVEVALRLERTTRPEEERLLDPFRTARPHTDESILGVSRFEIATLAASAPLPAAVRRRAGRGGLAVRPFVEAALAHPTAARSPSLFRPERFFGASHLWSVAAGARVAVGTPHHRMGRYGVAAAPEPAAHRHGP